MVTTGNPQESSVTSEIIDLDNPELECEDYLPYPNPNGTSNAVGGLLFGNTPYVCGGRDYVIHESRMCYFLGNNTVQNKLSIGRPQSAAVVSDNGDSLWITGN